MARKLDAAAKASGKTKTRQKPADDAGADDAAVLHPDLTITIAGRSITVREYRFVDGLRVRAKARPLVQDLHAQIAMGEALTEDIMDVLAKHDGLVRELIIEATEGADNDWIESLDESAGNLLMLAWWSVCGPFFVRQIARRISQAVNLKEVLVGLTSSTPSAAPATDPQTSSASATRAGS